MPRRGYGNRSSYPSHPDYSNYMKEQGRAEREVESFDYTVWYRGRGDSEEHSKTWEGNRGASIEAVQRDFERNHPAWHVTNIRRIEKPKKAELTPLEKRTQEIGDGPARIGFKYMSGQINVKDVVSYINTRGNWNKDTEADIARGAALAEEEGFAIKSRVQPVQGPIALAGPVRKKNYDQSIKHEISFPKQKKGYYPEPYTSPAILARREKAEQAKLAAAAAAAIPAKATKKAAPRREPTRAATGKQSGRVLSKYDVTAIDKQRKPLKEKDATGSKRIRPTKGEIRADLGKKRQKFDIYNVSKHRHVKE